MKKVEIIVIIGVLTGLLFKYLELAYAGIILSVSIHILAVFYFLFYLNSKDPLSNKIRKLIVKNDVKASLETMISSYALPLLLISVLFKLMHYPYASLLFNIGITACSLALIITFIKYQKNKSLYLKSLLLRLIIIGAIGILTTLVQNDTQPDLRDLNPDRLETKN
ncbi:hypothetical protein [Marinifilum caeruleilacunae]|uniref:Uncharacterized protein n=1 Tax=Marinifilum caeruleilacunae TaxID=2499076 RepID=A0ABX1WW97_9BACT|nr:hypothetical protein [Marinifilum caeruleilacunae]NOU60393.1 hypothetical protein [Marinifilum caeruleilacunae]